MRFTDLLLGWLLAWGPVAFAAAQAPAWQLALASRGGAATISALAGGPDGAVYLAGGFSGTVQFGAVKLTSQPDERTGFVARWNPAANAFDWGWALGPTSYAGITALAVRDTLVYAAGAFTGDFLSLPGASPADTTDQPGAARADALVLKLADRGSHAALTRAWPVAGLSENCRLAVLPGGVYLAGTFGELGLRVGTQTLPQVGGQRDRKGFLARLPEGGGQPWLRWLGGHYDYLGETTIEVAAQGSTLYVALNVQAGDTLGLDGRQIPANGMAVLKVVETSGWPQRQWTALLTGTHEYSPGLASLAVDGPAVYLAGAFEGDTLRMAGQPLAATGASGTTFVAKLLDAGAEARPGWWQRVAMPGYDYLPVAALAARAGHLYLAMGALGPRMQLGRLTVPVPNRAFMAELLVANLDDTGPTAAFTWATTAGIRGLRRYKWVFIPGFREGIGHHEIWHRFVTPNTLVLAGPRLYLAGDTEGTTRFGRQRLRYPVRGRRAGFLAGLPVAP